MALRRIKGVALYLRLIVLISVRRSDRYVISGLHCRALVMVDKEHKADGLIANSKKRALRNSQRLMYEAGVLRLSRSLVITIIVCLSWAVNHYRDNAITYKASATKSAELKLANA